MELRQIEYFLAVERNKSFTKAANELCVTQPAITISVRNLENELGAVLFNRINGKLTLTPEGQIFYNRAQSILNSVQAAVDDISDFKLNNNQKLSIRIPNFSCSHLRNFVLTEYHNEYPNIQLDIYDTNGYKIVVDEILHETTELGFLIHPLYNDPRFERLVVTKVEMGLLVNKDYPLTQLKYIEPSDLNGESFILYTPGTTYVETIVNDLFKTYNIDYTINSYVYNTLTMMDLVAEKMGVALILTNSKNIFTGHSNLVIKRFKPSIQYNIALTWKKGKILSETSNNFINFMRKNYKKLL